MAQKPGSRSTEPRRETDFGRWMLLIAAGLVAAAVGVSASVALFGPSASGGRAAQSGSLGSVGEALVGGPFDLVDHRGRPVDETLLEGRLTLLYFGFTYCPDFCPTELANMVAAKDALAARGVDAQLVFVTVDPERDDQQTLSDYVTAFHPDMIGLRGSPEQVRAAAQAYRVYVQKVETPDAPDGYTMDHSTFVYAMGPDGRFITQFGYATPPERVADKLAGAAGV